MSPAWSALHDEIARWRDAGRVVDFWWRDDDACRPDPVLSRLIRLADQSGVPLALAVIPSGASREVLEPACAQVTVLQHGVDHRNRAAVGQKKSEFPADEPVAQALARLAQGRAWLAGTRTLAVLVPPWNRVTSRALLDRLAGAGYRGLSRFGARSPGAALPGLVQVNTHVDLIDWHGRRGFVGEAGALDAAVRHLRARRAGSADAAEATGWLSHHAVHDEACWSFLATLFEHTRDAAGVVWRGAPELFTAAAA